MKNLSKLFNHLTLVIFVVLLVSTISSCTQGVGNSTVDLNNPLPQALPDVVIEDKTVEIADTTTNNSDRDSTRKIQIALILDTSGSMEGLIEQAKSQLWAVVSKLTQVRYHGNSPALEIALYEYGNDYISKADGWVKRIMPFSSNLDLVSASLFALKTNGGEEYCGLVIQKSLRDLKWSDSSKDIKMIFIAGNEPFTQGPFDYGKACGNAREMEVVVNTIHCGDFEEGISGQWKSGALIAGGDYMSIDYNKRTVYVETPYDNQINDLGSVLNKTYIHYGNQGSLQMENMTTQDNNASSYSVSNSVSRVITKSSSFYDNSSWDLVDAYKNNAVEVKAIDRKNLPESLKKMTDAELEGYIKKQTKKREDIQKQINDLSKKRELYLVKHQADNQSSLQGSMLKNLKKQSVSKGFSW